MSGSIFDESFELIRSADTLASSMVHFGSVHWSFNEATGDGSFRFLVTNGLEAGRDLWNGRERDADSEMQYNRARCFDSTPGRWL
jgi:hypothetical protein